eukprot:TRINITY_DN20964_c0_g1_i1.p1 TRINITY_DN20964_c0_g1~~TRINITY_DN20964_c0_g1_i1.p1  ORF type:complete len:292 (+),score=11.13 TRINITY_DN20964_c0_g1_i1:55-930(+)
MAENLNDFVAGYAGGVAGLVVGQPFDIVKVRQQTTPAGKPTPSLLSVMRQIARQEGIFSFFRGIGPPLLGVGGINAVLFTTYGATSRWLSPNLEDRNKIPMSTVFVSGAAGGLACCTISIPTELLKCRVQIAKSQAQVAAGGTSTWLEFKKLVRTHGIRSLFRGSAVTALRDCPSFGAYFVIYEWWRRRIAPANDADNMTAAVFAGSVVSGGLAGVLSWLLVYPLDVVKTHLQAQDFANPRYKGMVDCARQLVRGHGYGVFVKGMNSCLVRAFPLNGMTFAVYELCMWLLN